MSLFTETKRKIITGVQSINEIMNAPFDGTPTRSTADDPKKAPEIPESENAFKLMHEQVEQAKLAALKPARILGTPDSELVILETGRDGVIFSVLLGDNSTPIGRFEILGQRVVFKTRAGRSEMILNTSKIRTKGFLDSLPAEQTQLLLEQINMSYKELIGTADELKNLNVLKEETLDKLRQYFGISTGERNTRRGTTEAPSDSRYSQLPDWINPVDLTLAGVLSDLPREDRQEIYHQLKSLMITQRLPNEPDHRKAPEGHDDWLNGDDVIPFTGTKIAAE